MATGTDSQQQLTGIGVSPGQASGPVVMMPDPVVTPPAGARIPEGVDVEQAATSRLRRRAAPRPTFGRQRPARAGQARRSSRPPR